MSDLSQLSDTELMQRYQLSQQPSGGPLRITVRPAGVADPPSSLAGMSDTDLMSAYAKSQPMGVGEDMLKSAGAGLVKGTAGLVGLPDTIAGLGAAGIDKATRSIGGWLGVEPQGAPSFPSGFKLPTTEGVTRGIENNLTGPLHEPQTKFGEYARTAAEFVPGAMLAPGGMAGNAIRYGALPGLASEAAGQATKGSAFEQPARIGAALLTGSAGALASRPSTAERSLRGQMPAGVTEQMVNDAHALMTDAAGRGVTLSWPEALSHVAQRPVLSDTMRHLEASGPTQGRMADFFAQRPQQIETAGRGALDNIAPANNAPSMIGPTAGQAATEVLDRVRGAINTATRPSYDAARQSLVPQTVHAAMRDDPLFVQALDAVRNDPARNSFVRGLSDRSTIVYDAVKKELEERARNAASPANPNASQQVSAATGSLGGDVRRIAVAADRNAVGLTPGQGTGNLEQALAQQTQLRQQYLEPLQRGPLGRIADKDITTQKAMDALFPRNPLPNSAQEIETTVRALVGRNPNVAGDLVRAHAESTFNEAMRNLQPGANQAGGAKFAARLVGNPQQAANFEAAVRALPYGDQRLAGFNRFLDIAEATGTRQNVGSKTAYNAEFLKGESVSGIAGEGVKAISRPVQAMKFLADRYERWQLGHNLNQLADILTNPAAVNQLRAIARMPANSTQAQAIALRIANLARSASNPVDQQRQ